MQKEIIMRRIIIFTLVLFASISLFAGTISVTGNAEVQAKPDIGTFSVSAVAIEDTTMASRDKTSQMMNTVISILKDEFSIAESDLRTSYIDVRPYTRYIDGEEELIGQRASQTLTVKVRDIDKIGEIYDRLMSIDSIELSSITLDKENKDEEMVLAMTKAIENAYLKASTYASAANASLGKVQSITDQSNSYTPVYRANVMYAAAASDEGAAIEYIAGDITLSATVYVTYELN